MFAKPEVSVFKEPLQFKDGGLELPTGPGLGLEIDPIILKDYSTERSV
jgi:L-alanine-DL-glutamate epimerase-like enolase superfamily enzyme